jgi:drug/metabolite transporter (DMT)-like permease
MLYPMLANFSVMAAFLPMVYQPMPVQHLGLLGIVSILAFAAGLCMIAAYRRGDAAIVAPMQYSQILWAAGYGILIFDEKGDTTTWIGAGIVIASGLYIVLRESIVGTSTNTPVLNTKSRYESGTAPRISLLQKYTKPHG